MGSWFSKGSARSDAYKVASDQQSQATGWLASWRPKAKLPMAPSIFAAPPDTIKAKAPAAAAAAKHKLNPKDFMFVGLRGGTHIKLPGSINGQQFVIEDCHDCDLYVMDWCAQVTVDDCTGCRIFVGPTDGSMFLRDSSNCNCLLLGRQLRTRGCSSCDLMLLCRTRPIIESSHGMGFACYSLPYAGLAAQLAAARISPFTNFWRDVYDFTPPGPGEPPHWRLLAAGASTEQLLGRPLPEQAQLLVAGAAAADKQAVVVSQAEPELPADRDADFGFVLFPPGLRQAAQQFVADRFPPAASPPGAADAAADASEAALVTAGAAVPQGALLIGTNEAAISQQQLASLASSAGWSAKQAGKCAGGPCVGLELLGSGAQHSRDALFAAAEQLGALCTASRGVAAAFRQLGVDG